MHTATTATATVTDCPACEGTGDWLDLDGAEDACPTCEGAGTVTTHAARDYSTAGWRIPIGGGWLRVGRCCEAELYDGGQVIHAICIEGAEPSTVETCEVCGSSTTPRTR